MSLDLWKPLKINNLLLQNIFNQPIDGKVLNNGKIQAPPLIIFENVENKTYYCIVYKQQILNYKIILK